MKQCVSSKESCLKFRRTWSWISCFCTIRFICQNYPLEPHLVQKGFEIPPRSIQIEIRPLTVSSGLFMPEPGLRITIKYKLLSQRKVKDKKWNYTNQTISKNSSIKGAIRINLSRLIIKTEKSPQFYGSLCNSLLFFGKRGLQLNTDEHCIAP